MNRIPRSCIDGRRDWWITRTIFAKGFWHEPFKDYPQTLEYMPQWRPMERLIQWLCGRICDHEHSKTEWGHGGGEYVVGRCRWCDKKLKMPISEARFRHSDFNKIRPDKLIK